MAYPYTKWKRVNWDRVWYRYIGRIRKAQDAKPVDWAAYYSAMQARSHAHTSTYPAPCVAHHVRMKCLCLSLFFSMFLSLSLALFSLSFARARGWGGAMPLGRMCPLSLCRSLSLRRAPVVICRGFWLIPCAP